MIYHILRQQLPIHDATPLCELLTPRGVRPEPRAARHARGRGLRRRRPLAITSYCITSYYIISYHIITYEIRLYQIRTYYITSYYIISYHVILCFMAFYHTLVVYVMFEFISLASVVGLLQPAGGHSRAVSHWVLLFCRPRRSSSIFCHAPSAPRSAKVAKTYVGGLSTMQSTILATNPSVCFKSPSMFQTNPSIAANIQVCFQTNPSIVQQSKYLCCQDSKLPK